MKPTIKLAHGNAKIEKALIWNLRSQSTCPGATEMCKEVCYAHNAEVFRKHRVTDSRDRHTAAAKSPNFKELMNTELKSYRPLMRIHESGDFFNQKYLDDWVAIIKENPTITFWAYTKSYNLNFTEALKLKNLYLRYSVDATTKHYPEQEMSLAAMSAEGAEGLVCPGSGAKGHDVKCMKDCFYCVESRESVTFRPHGRKVKLATDMEQAAIASSQHLAEASK